MPDSDENGEGISKSILDWLTRVGLIATTLVAILSLIFREEDAKKIAYGVAILLAIISSAIIYYQHLRAKRLKIAELPEPLLPSAALRGLLPFEEGDQLPGRAREVQTLYTLVTSSTFRFGVLWGESGCGKTSLLRAGLIPKLKNEKRLLLYIGRPTEDPQEAARSALLKINKNLDKRGEKDFKHIIKTLAQEKEKIILIFDQFEEFFLTNRTKQSRSSFINWLGSLVEGELPIAILISIRADFFAHLQNFAPQIPEPTSTRSTYQLQNFDPEQAKQIFYAAAKADGIPFEAALIQAVINELGKEGFIRPAELQVAGMRLERKKIFSLNKYIAAGGANGVISSFISDEIKSSADPNIARLILRLMCTDTSGARSPADLAMKDILRRITGESQTSKEGIAKIQENTRRILDQFVTARILIHLEEDKYNLAHDYLALYVKSATEGVQTNTDRANRYIKRYVAEYIDDPKMLIPYKRVRFIQKYATPDVKGDDRAQELIEKSRRTFFVRFVAIGAFALIFLAAIYIYDYSSIDPIHFLTGRNAVLRENPFIPLGGGVMVFGSETPNIGNGEQPVSKISVEPFAIQKTEVSNHQYRICREAGGCNSDPVRVQWYNNQNFNHYPVVYVTAYQAREFCVWLGGDLPTTEQWERAARGLEGRPWPWDGPITPEHANLFLPGVKTSTAEIGKYPLGKSLEGDILDLIGNVSEWTRTLWIQSESGNPSSPIIWDGSGTNVTLIGRGGSYASLLARITIVEKASADEGNAYFGFRCVLSER